MTGERLNDNNWIEIEEVEEHERYKAYYLVLRKPPQFPQPKRYVRSPLQGGDDLQRLGLQGSNKTTIPSLEGRGVRMILLKRHGVGLRSTIDLPTVHVRRNRSFIVVLYPSS